MTEYTLFGAGGGFPDTSVTDSAGSLGVEFEVSTTAWATAIRFYRGTTSVEISACGLYQADSATAGTLLSSVTSPTYTGTGWVEIALPAPVQLAAAQRYRAVIHHTGAQHITTYLANYWSSGAGSGGVTSGILSAPNTTNAVGQDQCSFLYGAGLAYPTGSFESSNYGVDVRVSDVDPAGPGEELSGFWLFFT